MIRDLLYSIAEYSDNKYFFATNRFSEFFYNVIGTFSYHLALIIERTIR